MTDGGRRYFSGNTVEQAVMTAARHHRVDPRELDYRLLDRRHGFLKIRRRVVIEVDPQRPRREAPPSGAPATTRRVGPGADSGTDAGADAGAGGAPPSPEAAARGPQPEPPAAPGRVRPRRAIAARGEPAEAYREALGRLLDLAALALDGEVSVEEELVQVELWGEDEGRLVAGEGAALLAIEHLLPRVAGTRAGSFLPCRVDSRGFRELREEGLRELARRVASEVRAEGRPRILPPMDPGERRIVHLTITDEPGVTSASEGEGYVKRIVIRPRDGDR